MEIKYSALDQKHAIAFCYIQEHLRFPSDMRKGQV